MVTTLKVGNTTTEITKLTYSLKSKIGGYFSNNVDRSKMKVYILPDTKAAFYVTISETLTKERYFKVEIDSKLDIKEENVSIDKLYHVIDNFTKENNMATKIILDEDYDIFAIGDDKNDYFPYKLHKNKVKELTVNNSYECLKDACEIEDNYFIIAYPDLLVTIDKYTIVNYLGLLVKYYVESRFTVADVTKLDDKRIISFPGYQLALYHLKSILNIKSTATYNLKCNYENLSKMNLLPIIPSTNYWIEQNSLTIKTNRLQELLNKKESIIEKIRHKVNSKKSVVLTKPTIDVPEYFSHAFDEECVAMSWTDFIAEFTSYELNTKSTLDDWTYDIFATPVIIILNTNIIGLDKSDVTFFGFNGTKFFMVINSKSNENNLTNDEKKLRAALVNYIFQRFGYSIEIVFESNEEISMSRDSQMILLPNNINDDNYIGE